MTRLPSNKQTDSSEFRNSFHRLSHFCLLRVCCFNHANQCSKQASHCMFCSAYQMMICVLSFARHQYGSLTPSLSQIALYFSHKQQQQQQLIVNGCVAFADCVCLWKLFSAPVLFGLVQFRCCEQSRESMFCFFTFRTSQTLLHEQSRSHIHVLTPGTNNFNHANQCLSTDSPLHTPKFTYSCLFNRCILACVLLPNHTHMTQLLCTH